MQINEAVMWGGIGGLIMSALEAVAFLKKNKFDLPGFKVTQFVGYALVQSLLIGLGALAAYALAAGQQLDGVMAAIAAGIAAPEIFKKAGGVAAG
ncbi:MAG: hypothetical protein ACKVW3_13700 [Phycisphaerales bacterium]